MKINSQFLRSHPLLSLLPSPTLRQLASDAALQEYPKGSVLFRAGDPCEALYLIVSGRCESRSTEATGSVTEVAGTGDTLGDRELLNQEPYRSTVTVVTDSVLLRIPKSSLQELFQAKPSLAGRFSQVVSERVRIRREAHERTPVKRIVSLLTLSSRIHERAISQKLASVLCGITHQRVLLVHLLPHHEKLSLKHWALIEPTLNGEFCFADELRESSAGYFELSLQAKDDTCDTQAIAPLLSHFGAHFDYVIVQVNKDIPAACSIECAIQSDLTYVFLRADPECLYEFTLLLRQIEAETAGNCTFVNPVLCTDSGTSATDFSYHLRRLGHPVHSFLRGYPISGSTGLIDRAGYYALHMNRLAREIARCRIGLVLSSGGARGLAHIGVIQVLEENGIEVDVVAGASMGAYVGAVWAYGHDGEACEKIARELEKRWGLLHIVDPMFPPRRGFLSTRRVARRLCRRIGRVHFSELERPLRIVATDLDTLERVVFSTGEVVKAVEASIAIPGICVPVRMDGATLIDGGIADPLPVDVLREMGIERIIAVNTIPTPDRLRLWFDFEKEKRAQTPPRFSIRHWLNKHLNYFARGNLLDIMLRANHGVQTRVADAASRQADIVLRPWSYDSRWHDFTNPGKYIALGRKVAEDQLTEIKALAKNHEPTALAPMAVAG